MLDQNGIYISKKQASISAALLVLLCLLIFIAGYFWGKRSMIDGFSQKASQESFNDQVDYLLTMQSFVAKHGPLQEESEAEDDSNSVEKLLKSIPDAMEELGDDAKVAVVSTTVTAVKAVPANVVPPAPKTEESATTSIGQKKYAAVAGFAKKASAVNMINRLKNYKINLELKTKVSKSGKATKTWYQVVTPKMEQDELNNLVDRVVSIEHIKRKDVKIY